VAEDIGDSLLFSSFSPLSVRSSMVASRLSYYNEDWRLGVLTSAQGAAATFFSFPPPPPLPFPSSSSIFCIAVKSAVRRDTPPPLLLFSLSLSLIHGSSARRPLSFLFFFSPPPSPPSGPSMVDGILATLIAEWNHLVPESRLFSLFSSLHRRPSWDAAYRKIG